MCGCEEERGEPCIALQQLNSAVNSSRRVDGVFVDALSCLGKELSRLVQPQLSQRAVPTPTRQDSTRCPRGCVECKSALRGRF